MLAGVIAYLFKLYDGRRTEAESALREQFKAHAEEIGKRDAREQAVRAEYEGKMRELAERYANDLKVEHRENRAHEDNVRKEFTEIVDGISVQAQKSAEGMTNALDRLHTHLVRPTRRSLKE